MKKYTSEENYNFAVVPGGIEIQEHLGQLELVDNEVLPIKYPGNTWEDLKEIYEVLGIKVLDFEDDIFVNVNLPEGWKKKPQQGSSYWSDLIDSNGGVRASIFYKAAFYDKSSHISFNKRFVFMGQRRFGEDYSDPNQTNSDRRKLPLYGYIFDNKLNDIVYETDKVIQLNSYEEDKGNFYDEQQMIADVQSANCYSWLKQNYPDHESVFAYWDQD